MKKLLTAVTLLLATQLCLNAQTSDFIQGGNIIFEDNFSIDPVGDFPAKWSTSSGGQVVELDGFPGKWLKINASTAVNPELKKKLPEDCTIEFDLVIKSASCPVFFGVTPLSDVAAGNVFYKKAFVTLQRMAGYPAVVYGKDVQDLGNKTDVSMDGYVDRILHISVSVNKTRFRAYMDETKVVDQPKLLTPEYRNNFFIAGGEVVPAPEEGIYISNVRIASGEADPRRLLIKQLLEQGSVVTNEISFNPQTNEMQQTSYRLLDTLGQTMMADPSLNIEINGMQETPYMNESNTSGISNTQIDAAVKIKVEKIKSYLVQKFSLGVDRVVAGATNKINSKVNKMKTGKTGQKVMSFLTEFVKL